MKAFKNLTPQALVGQVDGSYGLVTSMSQRQGTLWGSPSKWCWQGKTEKEIERNDVLGLLQNFDVLTFEWTGRKIIVFKNNVEFLSSNVDLKHENCCFYFGISFNTNLKVKLFLWEKPDFQTISIKQTQQKAIEHFDRKQINFRNTQKKNRNFDFQLILYFFLLLSFLLVFIM